MCYDVAAMTRQAADYAKRHGSLKIWQEAKTVLPPMFHVSGFDEPDLPVITNENPERVQPMQWGFLPTVYAPLKNGRPINTLNARDDKIFTDQSLYHQSAKTQRCLVMIDGFFDHHKKNGVAYPHFIQLKSKEPFMVGGLWQTFVNERDETEINTVTLVTGPANKEMAWVHNEPAYSPDSRMIYIVPKDQDDQWLNGNEHQAQSSVQPLPDNLLDYYPCKPIKANKKLGRTYLGNVPQIQNRHHYPELEIQQGSLF